MIDEIVDYVKFLRLQVKVILYYLSLHNQSNSLNLESRLIFF